MTLRHIPVIKLYVWIPSEYDSCSPPYSCRLCRMEEYSVCQAVGVRKASHLLYVLCGAFHRCFGTEQEDDGSFLFGALLVTLICASLHPCDFLWIMLLACEISRARSINGSRYVFTRYILLVEVPTGSRGGCITSKFSVLLSSSRAVVSCSKISVSWNRSDHVLTVCYC